MSAAWATFKGQLEQRVVYLTNQLGTIYQNMCNEITSQCWTKSYNECQGTDEKECIEYPKRDGCAGSGISVPKSAGVKFPWSVDVNSLQNIHKLFICASTQVDPTLKAIKVKYNTKIIRVYFGTYFGYFRAYPAWNQQKQSGAKICQNDFDPRIRPWYASATSGPKNIVIIIDSTMDRLNFPKAQLFASGMLNTLGVDDFVGIIEFSSTARILNANSVLLKATLANKNTLITGINSITARTGDNNYGLAFDKLKDLMTLSSNTSQISRCNTNVVFFVTDRGPSAGENTSELLLQKLQPWSNLVYDIKFFSYLLGSNIQEDLLKSISCMLDGEIFRNTNPDVLINIPDSYLSLAGSMTPQPIWSQPYSDALTGIKSVSVGMPITYVESGATKILGAVNIAIPVQTFLSKGLTSEEQITSKLVKQPQCMNNAMTSCQIEQIRSQKCQPVNCTVQVSSRCQFTVSASFIGDPPLKNNKEKEGCCGLTTGSMIGLIVGLVGGVLLLVLGAFIYWKCRKRCNQEHPIFKMPTARVRPPMNTVFQTSQARSQTGSTQQMNPAGLPENASPRNNQLIREQGINMVVNHEVRSGP